MSRPKPTYKPKIRPRQHGRRAQRKERQPRVPLGSRHTSSVLSPFKPELIKWFAQELPYAEILRRLEEEGCKVALTTLSRYREKCRREQLQEIVLDRITSGAAAHERVSKELEKHGVPEVSTLIALVQNLIFTIATKGQHLMNVEDLTGLLRPVLDWSKIQLKERETAVQERRVKLLEEAAAKAREAQGVAGDSKLSPEQKVARIREIFSLPAPK